MHGRTHLRLLAVVLILVPAIGACSGKTDASKAAVEKVVRADFRAENGKHIDAFLALWTDEGLKGYDVGSRKQLRDPKSEEAKNFGSEPAHVVRFVKTIVTSDKASVVVDAALEHTTLAATLYRLEYSLIKKDEDWLLDGFAFKGSPPPPKGTEVVDIKALEYGFVLSKNRVPGDIAFKFSNIGKQQHELAFFKGPDGVDVATAKKALENISGDLETIPKGYTADHLSFTQPGESFDISFEKPIASGTYIFACYLPQGGLDKNGEPNDPKGKPHIQLGMINRITIE